MTTVDPWVGMEIGEGRYVILGRVGEGNMGQVYRARDRNLATEVVIKFPIPPDGVARGKEFFDRFDREIRSLVDLSHPHVVKVIDVGSHEGQPYVVMQYLSGGSLKDRMTDYGRREPRALTPASLGGWLMEIAKALDFIHGQNFLHRDVKPANILFDRHGHAFLGDLGIIKALAENGQNPSDSSLTAPGFLLGTPNYVAPEVVMGRSGDARVDQYALAMTVHEVLTGTNVMAGLTPSATVVNQTTMEPPPLFGTVPDVPIRLSNAVRRTLSKDPRSRFDTCAAFAREVLADLPMADGSSWSSDHVSIPSAEDSDFVVYTPAIDPSADSSTATVAAPLPSSSASLLIPEAIRTRNGLKAFALGGGAVLVMVLLGISVYALRPGVSKAPDKAAEVPVVAADPPVEINIAYGTEKKKWLETALEEFEKTHDPNRFKINLIGLGSVEEAQTILEGDKAKPIHVWSPASSAYRDVFESEWRIKHGGKPIARAENLALTPMVFVMWKTRHDEFIKKYKQVNFQAISMAMHEPGGWGSIANKPEWGLFKFGHTDPNKSNSGLQTLILTAYELSSNHRNLTVKDVLNLDYQEWLRRFESGLTRHGSTLTSSTGTMMEEMVLRGPSQYDCLILYENLAIDYLTAAREHWEDLHIVYPEPNLWNEHPYYILDVPWSNRAKRTLATEFLEQLMSEPIQRRALDHGFRPGNLSVPIKFPESPFVKYMALGLKIEIPLIAEPPKAEVVANLLSSFKRIDR